jgi:hypothetical protein
MTILFNTGKVIIGSRYTPPAASMSAEEEMIQATLLDKPEITPEDVIQLIGKIINLFFIVAAVCLIAGVLYALFTNKLPSKPIPDCGSCRIYKEKTK